MAKKWIKSMIYVAVFSVVTAIAVPTTIILVNNANTYTITYEDTKNVTNENPSTYMKNKETVILKNLSDTKDYDFIGWYIGDTQVTEIQKGTTGDLTITARWNNTYTITYENTKQLSNENPTTYIKNGDTIVLQNLSSTNDYDFVGWFNGTEQVTEIIKGTTGNLTLTAKWNNEYTITYENTKGQTHNNPTSYKKNEKTIQLQNLDNTEDCEFLGWYIGYKKVTEIAKESTGNLTIMAIWTDTYFITYENTKDVENTNPITYTEYSGTIFLNNLKDTQDYDFIGWYNGEEQVTEIAKGSKGNITLTAKWNNKYTITYENTKEQTNNNPTTYTKNGSTIVLENLENTTNYEFLGWFVGGNKITEITSEMYGNLVITAEWTEIYTITYVDTKDLTNTNRTSYTALTETFELEYLDDTDDYDFVGWYNGEEQVTEIAKGTIGNLTLTAKWNNEYTITYENTKEQTNNNPTTYTKNGDTITLTNLEDVEGYTFLGWYIGTTKVDVITNEFGGNLTISALWTEVYTITYSNTRDYTNDNQTTYTPLDTTFKLYSLTDPTGEFEFLGWYNEYGQQITQITKGSKENFTLTAKWNSLYLNISYGEVKGVTALGSKAKSIEVPEGVTSIAKQAFFGQTNLIKVILPTTLYNISTWAFWGCKSLLCMVIQSDITSFGNVPYRECDRIVEVYNLSGKTVTKDNGAFYGVASNSLVVHTSLEEPSNLKLSNGVYYYVTETEKIAVSPEDLNATNLTLDDDCTSVNKYAFTECKSLTSITLKNQITEIKDSAFNYCTSLTSIQFPDSLKTIGNYVFCYCESLTTANIPNSVESVGNGAFYSCSSLGTVTIGTSVQSIGDRAFYACDSLESIEIPDNVTSLGSEAFYSCDKLTSAVIGNGVTVINYGMFDSCNNLTSVKLGKYVTTIGSSFAYFVQTLHELILPITLKSIGGNFNYYKTLNKIYYEGTKTEFDSIEGCDNLWYATIYCYSETKPEESGNYWYYDGEGNVAIWTFE